MAAEGAVTLKEMVGLAPHLSHAVQLQRLRTFFGLGEDDKLEICPTGNSIASGMGFSNVAMVGRAPKSPVTNSTSSQGAPLTTGDAFQPYKMDISNALKRFDRPNDTPISITAKSLLSPKATQGLTLGKPLTLEAIDKGDLLKAYKPPASITDKFLIASFAGTLRGIVLPIDGKPVANAAVQLTNNQTKVKIVVKPDGEGKFVADGLVAGDYSIITSADRFTDQQKFTRVELTGNTEVNFVLTPNVVRECDYRVTNMTSWPVRVGQIGGPFSVRLAANESTVFSRLAIATKLSAATEAPDPAKTWTLDVSCDRPTIQLAPG